MTETKRYEFYTRVCACAAWIALLFIVEQPLCHIEHTSNQKQDEMDA